MPKFRTDLVVTLEVEADSLEQAAQHVERIAHGVYGQGFRYTIPGPAAEVIGTDIAPGGLTEV